MLLFAIGLELLPDCLRPLQRSFWIGRSIQVLLTAVFAASALALLGPPARETSEFAAAATMSSTAVVLKLLQGRGELEAPYGRSSLALLVFHDLFLGPLVVLLPWLAPGNRTSGVALGKTGFGLLLQLVRRWPPSRVGPQLFPGLFRTRISEPFLLVALLVCFGSAFLADELVSSSASETLVGRLEAFAAPSVDTLLPASDPWVLLGLHEALHRAVPGIDPLETDPSAHPSADLTPGGR